MRIEENEGVSKKVIYLIGDSFLIVKMKSGVFYTNQTGGQACHHPEIEGIVIPLSKSCDINALYDVSVDDDQKRNVIDINMELEKVLDGEDLGYTFELDLDCIDRTEEAWVHIIAKRIAGYDENKLAFSNLKGFGDCFKAVLTYVNSD